jgi:hypothetical protein
MRPAHLAAGIALIIVGGFFLAYAGAIFMLYHNGPETCTTNQPVDSVPTCASIDTTIAALAIVGIIFFVVAGIVLFLGREKADSTVPIHALFLLAHT